VSPRMRCTTCGKLGATVTQLDRTGGQIAGRHATMTATPPQALELLASRPSGITKNLLVLAHGFDTDMIAGLVRTGLATADREIVNARGKTIEVVRITITDAGRRALEG
jgi:hypothetical protein